MGRDQKPRTRVWPKHPTGRCETVGCSNLHWAKGLCMACYQRMKRGSKNFGQVPLQVRNIPPTTPKLGLPVKERSRRRRRFDALRAKYGDRWTVISDDDPSGMAHLRGESGDEEILPEVIDAFVRARWLEEITPLDSPALERLYSVRI